MARPTKRHPISARLRTGFATLGSGPEAVNAAVYVPDVLLASAGADAEAFEVLVRYDVAAEHRPAIAVRRVP
jgi:hypothetical protein